MPQGFASGRIEREQITRSVRSKEEMACSGQNTGNPPARTNLVSPADDARSRIDCHNCGSGPQTYVSSRPAFRLASTRHVEHAPHPPRGHVKQIRLGIEARRHPVSGASASRRNQRPIGWRLLLFIRNRLPHFINSHRPVGFDEGGGDNMPTGFTV